MSALIMLQLKVSLQIAMKEEVRMRKEGITSGDEFDKVICRKTVSRAIISMCPEIGKKPGNITDDDTIKLLKKYISQEKERSVYELGYLKEKDVEGKSASEVKKLVNDTIQTLGDKLNSYFVEIAQKYLPKQASKEEIIVWINDNLDLSKFKNKMQAMSPIMKEFKGCDGNFVKDILRKENNNGKTI